MQVDAFYHTFCSTSILSTFLFIGPYNLIYQFIISMIIYFSSKIVHIKAHACNSICRRHLLSCTCSSTRDNARTHKSPLFMCLLKKIISKKIFTILKTLSVCEVGWEHFGDRASCWTHFGDRASCWTHFGDRATCCWRAGYAFWRPCPCEPQPRKCLRVKQRRARNYGVLT